MSPGTRFLGRISGAGRRAGPAALSESMLRMASSAFSALPSWNEADEGVDEHHAEDHAAIHPVPERSGDAGGAEQHIDQDIVELQQETSQRAALPKPWTHYKGSPEHQA
jgi:hypothetical protein